MEEVVFFPNSNAVHAANKPKHVQASLNIFKPAQVLMMSQRTHARLPMAQLATNPPQHGEQP